MNWRERVEAEQTARSAWVRTDQTLRTKWVNEDEAARILWIRTCDAIRANRELSYKGREDALDRAYRTYQDTKDQNWANLRIRKDRAWQTFQDKLAEIGAEFARWEQADRAAHNGTKQDSHDRRDNKGRFTAKVTEAANRPAWDNGDRSDRTFRILVKRYHPDNGGDTRTFQDILIAFGRGAAK